MFTACSGCVMKYFGKIAVKFTCCLLGKSGLCCDIMTYRTQTGLLFTTGKLQLLYFDMYRGWEMNQIGWHKGVASY